MQMSGPTLRRRQRRGRGEDAATGAMHTYRSVVAAEAGAPPAKIAREQGRAPDDQKHTESRGPNAICK